MSDKRWTIWKHDCVKHGAGDDQPCDPPCEDPWQVDPPDARGGETFPTLTEAIAWFKQETEGNA